MCMNDKKTPSKIRGTLTRFWVGLLMGGVFGLFAPIIGVFLGLQVNTHLGTLFAAPLILVSLILDIPIGDFSLDLQILSLLLSVIIGAVLGAFTQCLLTKLTE